MHLFFSVPVGMFCVELSEERIKEPILEAFVFFTSVTTFWGERGSSVRP